MLQSDFSDITTYWLLLHFGRLRIFPEEERATYEFGSLITYPIIEHDNPQSRSVSSISSLWSDSINFMHCAQRSRADDDNDSTIKRWIAGLFGLNTRFAHSLRQHTNQFLRFTHTILSLANALGFMKLKTYNKVFCPSWMQKSQYKHLSSHSRFLNSPTITWNYYVLVFCQNSIHLSFPLSHIVITIRAFYYYILSLLFIIEWHFYWSNLLQPLDDLLQGN